MARGGVGAAQAAAVLHSQGRRTDRAARGPIRLAADGRDPPSPMGKDLSAYRNEYGSTSTRTRTLAGGLTRASQVTT